MKRSILVFVISLLVGIWGTAANKNKSTLSKTPLTAEEMELYGIFLDSFVGKGKGAVNFSEKTFPLAFDVPDNEGSCIEGIRLKSLVEAGQTIHMVEASIADGRAIHLVDPSKHKLKDPGKAIEKGDSVGNAVAAGFQAGLLSVSEIAFDEAHHFAVFKFSFICGSLCGRGGTLVFEKIDGRWKQSNRACPSWIA
jgi:hypothetical protein